VGDTIACLRYYAGLGDKIHGESAMVPSKRDTRRVPAVAVEVTYRALTATNATQTQRQRRPDHRFVWKGKDGVHATRAYRGLWTDVSGVGAEAREAGGVEHLSLGWGLLITSGRFVTCPRAVFLGTT
jgi:hypothetical protein